jgi:hypothetical protein
MRFETLELSIDLIRKLRQPMARLRTRDAELSGQIRAAASSVALNLAEGRKRTGKDRLHHWRVAAGSADEGESRPKRERRTPGAARHQRSWWAARAGPEASAKARDRRGTALQVAVAWGEIDEPDAAEALGLLDRVLAMLWRLTH